MLNLAIMLGFIIGGMFIVSRNNIEKHNKNRKGKKRNKPPYQ